MVIPILLVLLTSLFPAVFLYTQNYPAIALSELGLYAGLFFGIGLLVFFLLLALSHKRAFSAVAAFLFIMVTFNVGGIAARLLQRVMPWLPVWILPVLFFIILVVLCVYLYKKARPDALEVATTVLCIVMAGLTLVNAAGVIPKLLSRADHSPEVSGAQEFDVSGVTTSERPNIYIIVLDEYSGIHTLAKFYNYDNSPFYDALRDMGFTVSENSHSYSTDSESICLNMLNLDYVAQNYPEAEQRYEQNHQEEQPLYTLMQLLGYTVYEAESVDLFALPSRLDTYVEGTEAETQNGETVTQLLIRNTLFYPFEEKVALLLDKPAVADAQDAGDSPSTNPVLKVFDFYDDPDSYDLERAVTISWIKCPHTPFQFNRTGGVVAWENRANWADTKYYLDQLLYMNTRTTQACATIIENDPEAIIILQSDHAARGLPNMSASDRTNILNAVYYGGQPFEAMGEQNGLNTIRTLLSVKFGLDLPALEEIEVSSEVAAEESAPLPLHIASGDVTVEAQGNALTFTNTGAADDVRYAWEVRNSAGDLLAEQAASDTPSFTYTHAAEETAYVIALETRREDESDSVKKLCYLVETDENGQARPLCLDLQDFSADDVTDVSIDGDRLMMTNSFMPEMENLLVNWYVMDAAYSAYIKAGYSTERSAALTLEPHSRQLVVGYVRIKLGDAYDEVVNPSLFSIVCEDGRYAIVPFA